MRSCDLTEGAITFVYCNLMDCGFKEFNKTRGGYWTAATSKMERFVIIIVKGFQPLTIITKHSILDVATVLNPLLKRLKKFVNPNIIASLVGEIAKIKVN